MANMLQLNERAKWFALFGDFRLEEYKYPYRTKTFEDMELEAVLDEY